jgi:hypothetical protein
VLLKRLLWMYAADADETLDQPLPGREILRQDQHLHLASRKTLIVGLLPPISGAKVLKTPTYPDRERVEPMHFCSIRNRCRMDPKQPRTSARRCLIIPTRLGEELFLRPTAARTRKVASSVLKRFKWKRRSRTEVQKSLIP